MAKLAWGLAALVLVACGGGGSPIVDGAPPRDLDGGMGTDSSAEPPPFRLSGRVVVEPAALLFTQAGEQARLRARVLDTEGRPLQRVIAWETTRTASATVSADGTVTSGVGLGSAQIRARAGDIVSDPVQVLIAEPPAGALLVTDAQVVGMPTAVSADQAFTPGQAQRRVVLTGVAEPQPGTIVLAREGKPVGGRVVSSTARDTNWEVVLEGLPLSAMFRRLDLDAVFRIDQRALALADLPPPPLAPLPRGRGREELAPLRPKTDEAAFKLGPFDCEFTATANLITGELSAKLVPELDFTLRLLKDAGDDWQEMTVRADGALTTTIGGGLRVAPGFGGSLGCKLVLRRQIIPLGGPLAAVVAFQVPLGAKFGAEAAASLSPVEIKPELKGTSKVTMGFSYTPQTGTKDLSKTENTFEPKVDLTGFAADDLPFRIEGNLFVGAFAGLDVGSPAGQALGVTKPLEMLEAFLGGKLEFKLAPTGPQLVDPAFAANYELKLVAEVGLGSTVQDALKWLGGTATLKASAGVEKPLGRSPFGRFTADKKVVRPQDTVTLTVNLDPSALTLAGINNVKEVRILQAKPGRPPELVKTLPGGGRDYGHTWTPSPLDRGTHVFFATLVSVLAPGLPLEVNEHTFTEVRVGEPTSQWRGMISWTMAGQQQKKEANVTTSYEITGSGRLMVEAMPSSAEGGSLTATGGEASASYSSLYKMDPYKQTAGCRYTVATMTVETLMGKTTVAQMPFAGLFTYNAFNGAYLVVFSTPRLEMQGMSVSTSSFSGGVGPECMDYTDTRQTPSSQVTSDSAGQIMGMAAPNAKEISGSTMMVRPGLPDRTYMITYRFQLVDQ